MSQIHRVVRGRDTARVEWLRELTAAAGHRNVFNVSLARSGGRLYLAWRALPPGATKPFHAFATSLPEDGLAEGTIIDLTERARAEGVRVTADPKLFEANGDVYATFNTGYVRGDGRNDIYVMRLTPELGAPQRTILGGRRRIEKNWVFYGGADGRLAAVHRLFPLNQISLVEGELGGTGPLVFEHNGLAEKTKAPIDFALGTPLLVQGDRALGIVHEKPKIMGRRIYMGRPATITGLGTKEATVEIGQTRLVHSWWAMRPQRRRHNPVLLSATYFSGITELDGQILVGYGINDKEFGISTLDRSLWS